MNWVYGYWCVGAAVLTCVYLRNWRNHRRLSDDVRALYVAPPSSPAGLPRRILVKGVVPVLAFALLAAFWPAVAFLEVQDHLQKHGVLGRSGEPEFLVQRKHLLERLTVAEVEQREMVVDPLRAVPDLPFGHLDAAWKAFLSTRRGRDELWSFSARSTSARDVVALRAGYVQVCKGKPGRYFLTTCQ